jgi:hypothetical protein
MAGQPRAETIARFLEILWWQGIEIHEMQNELWVKHSRTEEFHEIPLGSFLIFLNQPQKNNVLTLFERQVYPNRVNEKGEGEPPYDVAGWTLPLQMGVETYEVWDIRDLEKFRGTIRRVEVPNQVRTVLNLNSSGTQFPKLSNPLKTDPKIGLYKPYTSSMDEGWTRLVLDNHQIPYRSLSNADIRSGRLDLDAIILPADSESTILNGLSAQRYPAEFAGGIGDEGVENLKKFVQNGGKLICFDDSCDLVIKRFELPLRNVLEGLPRNQFYNPGSIVKLTVDTRHPYARGMLEETPAYFITSSAFEVLSPGSSRPPEVGTPSIIARYAEKDALMSGWMLGEKLLNSKVALAELDYGKGKLVLFGFRPQHRGQTFGTFSFIFNALEKQR